jgi:hypothetical protein
MTGQAFILTAISCGMQLKGNFVKSKRVHHTERGTDCCWAEDGDMLMYVIWGSVSRRLLISNLYSILMHPQAMHLASDRGSLVAAQL